MGTPVVPYVAPPRVFAAPVQPQQYMYLGPDGPERYAAAMAEYNRAVEGVNSANNAAYQAQVGSGTTLEQARLASAESVLERAARIGDIGATSAGQLAVANANAAGSLGVANANAAGDLATTNASAAGNLAVAGANATSAQAVEALRNSGALSLGAQTTAGQLAQTQAQIAAEKALQTGAQTFGASESAAERAARVAELTQSSNAAQALEALKTSGAMGLGAQTNAAELAQIQAQIESQKALQTGAQTFGASESAAERAARVAELTQSSNAAQSLEALRTAGAKDIGAQANAAELQRLQTQIAGTGGQASQAQAAEMARLQAQIAATGGQATQAQAAELQRLQTQIAATGGQATQAQAAEMARLQAQLGSAASLQSSAQTYGASETAAERAARMAELTQTQSGAKDLAGYQNTLQQQTEEQRYMRALAEQNNANARMDTVMGKFGFTGATPTGGAAGADPYASGATDTQELDAENAAFARAKDKIGQASRAASNSLSAEMASRGITGSGIEAQQLGLASDQAVGQIGDTAREQALASLQRRYQVSDRNAALTSTKRAQDIGLVQSLASLAKPTGGAAY